MNGRPEGDHRRPTVADEDDWFATPAVEPTDLPGEDTWEHEVEPPPAPADGLGRRQAIVVAAAIAAVALGAAGILLARSLGGSDSTGDTATAGFTAQVTTAPAVSTPTTTAPSTSTPTTSTPTTTAPSTSTTPTSTTVPTDTTLRPGATGAAVTALQQALTSLGYAPGAADGNYGAATTEAVKAFQKANGLAEDGVAGPQTIAAINEAVASG